MKKETILKIIMTLIITILTLFLIEDIKQNKRINELEFRLDYSDYALQDSLAQQEGR